MTRTRYPLAPLAHHHGIRSIHALARALNKDPATIRRANRDGLSDRCADEWATTLGSHPAEIWTTWSTDDAVLA